MRRRNFLYQISLGTGTIAILPSFTIQSVLAPSKGWKRLPASGFQCPEAVFPGEKRVPLGWNAFPVAFGAGNVTIIKFPAVTTNYKKVWLRITAAIDFREEFAITAFLPESRQEIGIFEIRYAHPFQPFQIEVKKEFVKQINKQGIGLTLKKGTKDTWFFGTDEKNVDSEGLQPHLLVAGESCSEESFRQNLLSMNSFSPFGWMGGCVIDALWEMMQKGDTAASEILKKQLAAFLHPTKGIIFESPMTVPRDGTFNSIEDFLPFTAIVGLYPEHIAVQNAISFLSSRTSPDGMIVSGNDITTEGCYTVAYPLAGMAVKLNRPELAESALRQLQFRTRYLTNRTTIFQRSSLQGHQTFANWGRGVAWYLLGYAKTIAILKNSNFDNLPLLNEIETEFIRAAELASKWQSEKGFWYCFTDKPATAIDNSATAGIATAFAWGHKLGLLDKTYFDKAKNSLTAMNNYLTPDGFLTHISQINRGGEELQASGYRVISQFGLGLMAQLKSVLG